jgi:ABC-type bacteriocin/lantibiotic exporter with double-glycine peptidase domain
MRRRAAKAVATSLCFCALVFAADPTSIWLDVPFVQQSREGCGAACIAMVMQYWSAKTGDKKSDAADATYILRQLHSPEAHGIYASSMEKYLQTQGYRTFAVAGTWNDLDQHLRKGRPLIVGLAPNGNTRVLHYVVIAGLDLTNNLVMFNDPAGRKLSKLDRRTFEKEWKATANWMLLAVPQSPAH